MNSLDLDAADALGDDAERAVGSLEHLLDARQHADAVDVAGTGQLDVGALGRDQADLLVAAQHVFDELHRAGLADGEGHHGLGKDHRVLQGKYRDMRSRPPGTVASTGCRETITKS